MDLPLEKAEVLNLKPGDVVALTVARDLSRQEAKTLRDLWDNRFRGRGIECVIVKDIKISVIHKEDGPAAQPGV